MVIATNYSDQSYKFLESYRGAMTHGISQKYFDISSQPDIQRQYVAIAISCGATHNAEINPR